MNKRISSALMLLCVFSFWMLACYIPENENNNSSFNEDESHYKGDNCMNCHYSEGPGEGWFSVAGSVYGAYQNHSVRILDANTGAILKIVPVDRLGNLYTTDAVSFANGITIDIISSSGQIVSAMSTVVYTAQCNLCHDDKFQGKIFL